MSFDFAEAKKQARRAVHDTLGVSAFYKATPTSDSVPCRVRLHTKTVDTGNIDGSSFDIVVTETVNKIIFNDVQARQIGVTRGGELHIPQYDTADRQCKVVMDRRLKIDGPEEEIWEVEML